MTDEPDYRPLFIVVEGLDGSGKSTQIDLLRDYFQARGQACTVTSEPTELPTGQLLRRVLRREVPLDPRATAALFAADRIEHLHHPERGILARLAAGHHVISSRYYFSSLAYQSEFAEPGWIAALNHHAKQTLPADLTIFLDLDPEESLRRIAARGAPAELFETRQKLTDVRESFRRAFAYWAAGERIHTVDAARGVGEIADEIAGLVEALRAGEG